MTLDETRTLIGLLEVANEQLQKVNALRKSEIERLYAGIRQNAATLVKWAVTAGGHTPSAIIASNLRRLIGDEPEPPEGKPCNLDGSPLADSSEVKTETESGTGSGSERSRDDE